MTGTLVQLIGMRKRILLAAGLLALGASLAGCGGGDDQPTATATTSDPNAQAVKYSQCMRENGVPSFPDPVDGRLQVQFRKGSDMDPDSEAFKKAQEACKALQPAGAQQQGQSGAQQEQMLKWVACMRQNGVPNMPDPQADGRMLIQQGSGVDMDSPAFKDAQTKCRDLQPGGN